MTLDQFFRKLRGLKKENWTIWSNGWIRRNHLTSPIAAVAGIYGDDTIQAQKVLDMDLLDAVWIELADRGSLSARARDLRRQMLRALGLEER